MLLNRERPTVQSAGEAGVFRLLEVLWKDLLFEPKLITDCKPSSMRKPGDDGGKLIIVKDCHELERELRYRW